jgi:hypothetical protein
VPSRAGGAGAPRSQEAEQADPDGAARRVARSRSSSAPSRGSASPASGMLLAWPTACARGPGRAAGQNGGAAAAGTFGTLGDPPDLQDVRLLSGAGEWLVRSSCPRQPAPPGVRAGARRDAPQAGRGGHGHQSRCRARRRPPGHRGSRGCRGSCCCPHRGQQPNWLTPTLCFASRASDLSPSAVGRVGLSVGAADRVRGSNSEIPADLPNQRTMLCAHHFNPRAELSLRQRITCQVPGAVKFHLHSAPARAHSTPDLIHAGGLLSEACQRRRRAAGWVASWPRQTRNG